MCVGRFIYVDVNPSTRTIDVHEEDAAIAAVTAAAAATATAIDVAVKHEERASSNVFVTIFVVRTVKLMTMENRYRLTRLKEQIERILQRNRVHVTPGW
ncbi:hypothetical protein V1477_003504 [Vespula maculifrons]|uniref:Uncharacterized protein n=2 Tax=Vespula TaxID=7451 RepID=A0A834NE63_VESVU|nr:hypothetical protein HZH66_003715 [Vespula vulgaris]